METDAERADAAAALDLVATSRARLADRLVTPWWFHPALGLVGACFLLGQASGAWWVQSATGLLGATGILLLAATYRRRTGVRVTALRAPRTRMPSAVLGALLFSTYFGTLSLHAEVGGAAVPVLGSLLLVLVTVVMGRRVDAALRAELRSEPRTGTRPEVAPDAPSQP